MRSMYDDCSSGGTCPPADSSGGAPSFASPPCGAGAVGGVSLGTAPSEESPSGGSWRATATDHAHNTATTSAVSRKPGRPGRAGTIMRYLFQACVVMGAKVYHAVRGSVRLPGVARPGLRAASDPGFFTSEGARSVSVAAGRCGEGIRTAGDRGHGARQVFQLEGFVHARATRGIQEVTRVGVQGVSGREDDATREVRPPSSNLAEQLLSVHLGHLEVEQKDIVRAALQLLQSLAGAARRVDGVPAIAPEGVNDQIQDDRLVVHRQDAERAGLAVLMSGRGAPAGLGDVRVGDHGQLDIDAGSLADTAVGPDPAAMILDDPVGDGP